jgi:hypothetical protein
MAEQSVFKTLFDVNVNGFVEEKNGLRYLSWANAWAEVKKAYPDAEYTIYENKEGWFYHTDGKTAWVKTGVTINGLEHIEYLPVMDFKNKSITLDQLTSFDVNKAIQRSLTKACARHGLGLYIYAGEDLPEADLAPMTGERRAKSISEIVALASSRGKSAIVNEDGYNGKPWDQLTDDELRKLKVWLTK